jgi:hypothetical protein
VPLLSQQSKLLDHKIFQISLGRRRGAMVIVFASEKDDPGLNPLLSIFGKTLQICCLNLTYRARFVWFFEKLKHGGKLNKNEFRVYL